MIRHLRIVRVLRVGFALMRVLPRYIFLLTLERFSLSSASNQAAWDRAHLCAAQEFRRVARMLAGAFTKAAQIAGARADVLPAAFIDELSEFHDSVPPRPFDALSASVERQVARPLDQVFECIDEEALAAASLAQVHRATLKDGRSVAVKIQYPEIRRIIPLDLRMLRRVVDIIQWLQGRVDVRSLVREVTRFIELELDFEREVISTKRLSEILARDSRVRVPRVCDELCGERVIVLEYFDGIQITHLDELRSAGHSMPDLARKIGAIYGTMIFEHGFFHGDPHPGNLLVLKDGCIGLLDFGLCKELPAGFARHVAEMMVSALIGDSAGALSSAEALGFDRLSIRPEHLRSLMLMMVGDSDSDEGFLSILSESRIGRIPEDFALVVRTLILLNGLSERLVPGRRLIQAELLQHLAAGVAREPVAESKRVASRT